MHSSGPLFYDVNALLDVWLMLICTGKIEPRSAREVKLLSAIIVTIWIPHYMGVIDSWNFGWSHNASSTTSMIVVDYSLLCCTIIMQRPNPPYLCKLSMLLALKVGNVSVLWKNPMQPGNLFLNYLPHLNLASSLRSPSVSKGSKAVDSEPYKYVISHWYLSPQCELGHPKRRDCLHPWFEHSFLVDSWMIFGLLHLLFFVLASYYLYLTIVHQAYFTLSLEANWWQKAHEEMNRSAIRRFAWD